MDPDPADLDAPPEAVDDGNIGKNTLPVYLFHSLAILVLVRTPLYTLMQGRLAPVLILAAALTVLLSREPLEKLLRKVKLPYKN